MSIKVRLKHSSTLNKAPLPADLDSGELALNINENSPAAYLKDSNGNIVKLAGAGAIGDAWTRTGTALSPATAGDDVNIGGTNISLKADGSAKFDGKVGIGTSTPVGNLDVTFSNSTVYSNSNMLAGGISQYIYNSSTTDGVASTLALAAKGSGTTAQAAISAIYSSTGVSNLAFGTRSGGNVIERMRLTSTGVGIGTASPGAALDVLTGSNRYVRFSTNGDASLIRTTEGGGSNRGFSVAGAYIKFDTGANTSSTIKEAARIDQDGRLLVGTSTARSNFYNATVSAQFQIEGVGGTSSNIAFIQNSNSAGSQNLIFAKSRGTSVGSNTLVSNGDLLGAVRFQGNDGSQFVEGAGITAEVDGTPGVNNMPSRLVFGTTANGSASPTERMTIKASGVVNIAATTVYADNTAAKAGGLVAGDIYRKADGTLMITF